jgi:hypothetical protein
MWIDYRKGMAPQSLHAPGYTPLAAVDPARSPFFAGHQLLQLPILRLELPQALDIARLSAPL